MISFSCFDHWRAASCSTKATKPYSVLLSATPAISKAALWASLRYLRSPAEESPSASSIHKSPFSEARPSSSRRISSERGPPGKTYDLKWSLRSSRTAFRSAVCFVYQDMGKAAVTRCRVKNKPDSFLRRFACVEIL